MKLLFITSNRVGDAVLSTGVLDHLLRQKPADVTVACGPVAIDLFSAVPGLDRLIPLVKRPRAGHWRALWRQTAGTLWDLVVDMRGSAFAYMVPTKRRLVFGKGSIDEHRVVQLARKLGLADHPPAPRLWLDAAREADAARLLPPGGPILAVGPTANFVGKQWPAERFAAAIARLTAPGGILPDARVAIFGAPNERPAAQPVLDSIPAERRIDLVGTVPLLTTAACIARSSLYIGNDSGLMHMAAAVGAPTLGLFGPSPERVYGPWGERTAVARGARSYEQIMASPDWDHRSSNCYMLDLTVERVVEAAERLLRRV